MSPGPEHAYDYDYIIKDLTKSLLRDLWDDDVRRRFVSKFVSRPVDVGVKPIVGIGIREIGVSGNKRLEFLSTIDGEHLHIKELLSSRNWGDAQFEVTNTGRILAATGTPRTVSKPAQGGDSIQRKDGPSGTLGCMVYEGNLRAARILTCLHVLAPINQQRTQQKEKIWWSGRAIGFKDRFEPIILGPNGDNKVDAALCKPDEASMLAPGLRQLGQISGYVRDPAFGLKVKKEGATSGVTRGAVRMKSLSMIVTYDTGDEAIFTDQLGIIGTSESGRFAEQGDSGAIIINDNDSPVGLLSAVAEGLDLAYANPIEAVFSRLEIRLP